MNLLPASFPICPHFEECAGCSEYLSLKAPEVWEDILTFFRSSLQSSIQDSGQSVQPPAIPHLHLGNPLHWRHRSKVAVRGTSAVPAIGLFKRFSHEVFPIPECLVHHPHLNQAFEWIRQSIIKHGIIPYQEEQGTGELRYIQGVVQRETGQVQLALVMNATGSENSLSPRWQAWIEQLANQHPSFWHSIWVNFNSERTNTIFGPKWLRVWGEEYLWEKFDGVEVCYGPASFGQANLPLFERLLHRFRELIPSQARVTEFYAGVGVIGLFIAAHCQWVRCSEMNPFAEAYFMQSHARLTSESAARIQFFSSSTQDSLSLLEDATTVIVDPPRKGLDGHFFSALSGASSIKQLVYMSCGWESFKRDCLRLCQEGWRVQSVDGYHFFPGSNHIELLVDFSRIDA